MKEWIWVGMLFISLGVWELAGRGWGAVSLGIMVAMYGIIGVIVGVKEEEEEEEETES